jgi:acetyltransferase
MRAAKVEHPERSHDILRAAGSQPLQSIFAPRSVAVIGATEKEGSVGRAVTENLAGFAGKLFLVNPKRSTVLGRPAFPTIAAVSECIDLAVIVTPARTVPDVIRECVAAAVPAAIIISAGFKEIGPSGAALEQEILAEARRGRMRIIGPNCLGVMSPHFHFNATFAAAIARPGPVAFVSQSGALCTAILDWSFRQNVGFSAFVSIGSMLDVGWGDLIYYLGDDPHTKSIVCYMESVGDARKFLSAAREVALAKPIIVIKVGRTGAAAKAAASHTGSLTGSDEVLDAAFRRVGVLRVNRIHELFNMADVLAKQPRPRGPRLAIITNAGGPGALSTDELIDSGARLAEFSPQTRSALDALLPAHWSHGNPIDILGDADADRYARAVDIVSNDSENDGLLVILTPQKMTEATKTAERLKAFAQLPGKPILASWMGGPEIEAGEQVLNDAAIPAFRYPDTAARAFQHMWRYSENLRALYETPALISEASTRVNAKEAVKVLRQALHQGRSILTEVESKQILAAYGIPVVPTRFAKNVNDATQIAREIGFPVVLKLFSETVTHKTDVGGVQLNIRTVAGVRKAWAAIERSCSLKPGSQHFLGCTVQPMVSVDGYELIIGSSIDPQFGPVLLFGAGGQLVEVLRDRALGLPPLNATLARRLIERTHIFTALQGVRGRKAIDLLALEQLLVRFSQLVVEQPRIAEIDINPLLASPDRLIALDARVVLHSQDVKDHQLPRPAIRPYPAQYVTHLKLKDGTAVTIRPIRPEDEPLMQEFHQTLSEQTVYHRYFSQMRLEQRTAHERLLRICFIDYDREMALVVEKDRPTGQLEIIAVGRLSKLHFGNEAEFALVVSDRWQRHGIGHRLLNILVQVGRDEQLERITAVILADNIGMQRVARGAGFQLRQSKDPTEMTAELTLK